MEAAPPPKKKKIEKCVSWAKKVLIGWAICSKVSLSGPLISFPYAYE
jgi:hypothetical protein